MSAPENPEEEPAKRTQEAARQGLAARTLPQLPGLSFTGLAVHAQPSSMDTVDAAGKGSANCTSFRMTRWGRRRSVRVEPGSTFGAKLAAGLRL